MSAEQIKPGYKRTEVGVIPEDWALVKIGDLGTVVRGGSPRPAGDPKYFNGTFIPWLTVAALTNIPESQLLVSETVGHLTEEGSKHSRTLEKGTLIIANSGATLGVAKILGITCCANDGIAAIINHRGGYKEFVCHYINTKTSFLRDVVATGNGQPNLNTNLIREITVPQPPEIEQRAIATALSDVDALLEKIDQLIAKKRDLKQATMQQLLTGQTRLPGFSGEWSRDELKCLVSTPITDGPHMTPRFYEAGVPFLSVNNLVDNRINLNDLRYISKEDDLMFSRKCKPKVGDILLGKAASVGKVAIVEEDFDFNIWSPIALVRAGNAIDSKFLYYQLLSVDCVSQIALLTNSSSQGNIGMGDIEKLQISYPRTDEQTAIATVLSDMDTEVAALETRREKICALKHGMMQELLTGRIRLL